MGVRKCRSETVRSKLAFVSQEGFLLFGGLKVDDCTARGRSRPLKLALLSTGAAFSIIYTADQWYTSPSRTFQVFNADSAGRLLSWGLLYFFSPGECMRTAHMTPMDVRVYRTHLTCGSGDT